jgi:hypothetical protein
MRAVSESSLFSDGFFWQLLLIQIFLAFIRMYGSCHLDAVIQRPGDKVSADGDGYVIVVLQNTPRKRYSKQQSRKCAAQTLSAPYV